MYRERKTLAFLLVGLSFLSLMMMPPIPSSQSGGAGASRANRALTSESGFAFATHTVGATRLLAQVDMKSLPSVGVSRNSVVPLITSGSRGSIPSRIVSPSTVSGSTTSNSVLSYKGVNGITQLTSSCNCVPPDGAVAAGPSSVVQMVNTEGELFTKQGVSVENFSLSGFFKTGNSFVSDPKIFYDAPSGRWFASVISSSGGLNGNVTFAVSTSSDPTSIWDIYSVNAGNYFADQPIIGVADDKFTISTNSYSSTANVVGAEVWVFSKAQMVAGLPALDFAQFGPDAAYFSVHPVQSLTSTGTLYMVSVGSDQINHGVSAVQLFSVIGVPPGNVNIQVDSLPISAVSSHVPGVQPNTTSLVNTDDTRVQDAVWSQGGLWYTFNEGCVPAGDTAVRSCIRLTQINTSTLTVTQDFDYCVKGTYCFYPAIQVDSGGSLGVIYGYSNSSAYPSLAVTGRTNGDPVNSLRQPQTIVKGTTLDTTDLYVGNGGRYGDFFGAAVDPSDQTLIWVEGEYHNSSTGTCWSGNCWSTFVDSMRVVVPASFSMFTSPTTPTITPGSSTTSNITLSSIGGFTGSVSLSVSVSPSGPTATLSPSGLNLNSGGSATSTLTVKTTTNTAAGTYLITINGTSGGLTTLGSVYVVLKGFGMSPSPGVFSLGAGSSVTSTLSLSSINGFSGNVSLSASVSPSGPAVSTSPSSVVLANSGQGSSTLTISTTSGTAPGLYFVSVTGTSGPQSSTLFIPALVTPLTISISNSTIFTGVTVTTSGALTVDAPSNSLTLSGSITVTATNSTTKTTLFSQTYAVTRTPIKPNNGVPGIYYAKVLLDVVVNPYPLGSKFYIAFSGTSVPAVVYQVVRNPDIDQNGIVDYPDLNIMSASYQCSKGQACYNPKADINADGRVNTADFTIAGFFFHSQDIMPNFSISASPTALVSHSGTSVASTIQIIGLNGFSGTVSLTGSVLPAGISLSLNPSSVNLTLGNPTATSTLIVNSNNPGFYTVTITGTSGSLLARSVTLTANIVDFAFNANPLFLDNLGHGFTSTITLDSLNGFGGAASLAISIDPPTGLTVTLTPPSPAMAAWGTGVSIMNVRPSCQPCFWTVTLTATVGQISHTVSIDVVNCSRGTICGPQVIVQTMLKPAQMSQSILAIDQGSKRIAVQASNLSNPNSSEETHAWTLLFSGRT